MHAAHEEPAPQAAAPLSPVKLEMRGSLQPVKKPAEPRAQAGDGDVSAAEETDNSDGGASPAEAGEGSAVEAAKTECSAERESSDDVGPAAGGEEEEGEEVEATQVGEAAVGAAQEEEGKEEEAAPVWGRDPAVSRFGAVLGKGVAVRASKIEGAGRGLFATRRFEEGDVVTEYVGDVVERDAARNLPVQTHLMSVEGVRIDGLKSPRDGVGAGSFVNDPFDPDANAPTYDYNVTAVTLRGDDALNRIVLRATKRIDDGDEVYFNYGGGRDVAMGRAQFQEATLGSDREARMVAMPSPPAAPASACSSRGRRVPGASRSDLEGVPRRASRTKTTPARTHLVKH